MTLNLKRNVTGLLHRSQNTLLQNRDIVFPLRLIPAPVRSLLIRPVLKWISLILPQLLRKTLTLPPVKFLPLLVHPVKDILLQVPVPTHRIRKVKCFKQQFSDEMDRSATLSDSEDGQLSDSTETPEQTEDMTYRETVRSVRAFMGWHHIPTFESDYTEPDKSNNPWKGKHPRKPTRISVAKTRHAPRRLAMPKLRTFKLDCCRGLPVPGVRLCRIKM